MFFKKVILFTLVTLTSCHAAFAHQPEVGRVTAGVGPWFYQALPSFDLPEAQDTSSLGVAIFANADVDSSGGVEVGMAYLDRKYYRKLGNAIIGERAEKFFVMVGYRHWFCKNFSGAVLIHSAYSMGEPDIIYSNSNANFETAAAKAAYNGLDLSFQYEHAIDEKQFWVVDLRYAYSFGFEEEETPGAASILLAYKQNVDVN